MCRSFSGGGGGGGRVNGLSSGTGGVGEIDKRPKSVGITN